MKLSTTALLAFVTSTTAVPFCHSHGYFGYRYYVQKLCGPYFGPPSHPQPPELPPQPPHLGPPPAPPAPPVERPSTPPIIERPPPPLVIERPPPPVIERPPPPPPVIERPPPPPPPVIERPPPPPPPVIERPPPPPPVIERPPPPPIIEGPPPPPPVIERPPPPPPPVIEGPPPPPIIEGPPPPPPVIERPPPPPIIEGPPPPHPPFHPHGRPHKSNDTCPGDLPPGFLFPITIVPVSQQKPDAALGVTFSPKTTPHDICTLFTLSIPPTAFGKKCTLEFLFPERDQLVTSAYQYFGGGHFDFTAYAPGTAVDAHTTWNTRPKDGHPLPGAPDVLAPGNQYVINSGSCEVPQGQSVQVSGMFCSKDTSFEYFQDFNPCAIGFYITFD